MQEIQENSVERKSIHELPNEILLIIFSYLQTHDIKYNIPNVCGQWASLAKDQKLWRKLIFKTVNKSTKLFGAGSWFSTLTFLKNTPELRNIIISFGHSEEEVIEILKFLDNFCPNLIHISFDLDMEIVVKHLKGRNRLLKSVRSLSLFLGPAPCQPIVFKELSEFKNLQRVVLFGGNLDSRSFANFIQMCSNLQHLDVTDVNFSKVNFMTLCTFKNKFRTLGIKTDNLDESCLKLFSTFPNLIKLSLMDSNCSPAKLCKIGKLNCLTKFHLEEAASSPVLTASSVAEFLHDGCFFNLKELKLHKSRLNDEGAAEIRKNCQNLLYLEVMTYPRSISSLTENALLHFLHCKSLRRFEILFDNSQEADWVYRFGQGFDRKNIHKVMQSIPADFDYDFLVIGSNPGGVACAREASAAGQRTAIITWKNYSPAESEGYDENLKKMAQVLKDTDDQSSQSSKRQWDGNASFTQASNTTAKSERSTLLKESSINFVKSTTSKTEKSVRKVRQSRLDMNNELFKRGQECRKLMHNATVLGDVVENAQKSGWRVTTTIPPLTINWRKMSEEIMDYVMEKNFALATALNEENVEIIEGFPTLINEHTVKVLLPDMKENEITSAVICLALQSESIIPEDVLGAKDYGITCDDFIRMNDQPGKTLIVGSSAECLECAGIVAGCRFPVTVVYRSKILKGYDSEISQMVIDDLKRKGVVFMEKTTLTSIENTLHKKVLASFIRPEDSSVKSGTEFQELFDTVLFAVNRKVFFQNLNTKKLGIEHELETQKIIVDGNDKTSIRNIYAIGDVTADRPEGVEISELAGKLLGKRLFYNESEFMDYSAVPSVIYTPTEYACVGISEDAALCRLGPKCFEVYYGYFKPLDFVIPAKKEQCFAKIIVFKKNDTIIGLHIFGPEAGEMIQGFAAAIRNGLTFRQFRTVVGVTATKVREILKLKETKIRKAEEEVSLFG